MARMDVTILDKELRAGKIHPVYTIVGEEYHLVRTAVDILKEKICGSERNEFSTILLDAASSDASRILPSLQTPSLLAGKILVQVKNLHKLDKELIEELVSYLNDPCDSSVLLLIAEKLDGRTKFAQVLEKRGAIIECKPLFDNKLPNWLNIEFKRHGRQISQQAASFLADMVGNDLSQLSSAIEKIVLYVGDKKLVDVRDIEQSITETHQRTVFMMTDAVGERSISRAMAHLHNIIDNGGAPLLLLNILTKHFRILSKAKEISGRMNNRADIARYIGVNPFFAQKYISQAANFSRAELRRAFRILHRCDREIKSSRLPDERLLERALISIMGDRDRRAVLKK
ncbi:MAG TPA: DNA polymerase III subunit delta [Rectinema sp.]|nr:DNA polymerase III subunit delta [Rectinema sp.]HQG13350.1 DNA polymerase III subunit delta [bacterium]